MGRRITPNHRCTIQEDACTSGRILRHKVLWFRCHHHHCLYTCKNLLQHLQRPNTDQMQLLAPANEALTSPCLSGPITEYPWVEAIALMTVFTMFFIELMASRFEIFGEAGESSDPTKAMFAKAERYSDNGMQLEDGMSRTFIADLPILYI